ncbi:uncharacterized protein LOC142984233 [Anticarsia gemmatalis]|uniref:uncharacterized protein LOC142984233 n=1 Tax=Anticarsia gemmatalis TaxID=129554 RepID=UPI003F757FDA
MWTNDVVLRLIDLYRSNECLWDTSNDSYKNKKLKNETWNEIALIMNLPRREVELKIHSLRSQFIRERKKFKNSVNADGVVRQSTWFAYEALMFLVKEDTATVESILRHEINQDSQSAMDYEIENSLVVDTSVNTDIENILENTEQTHRHTNKRRRLQREVPRNIFKYNSDETDEFDIYGQYIASELRNVKTEYGMLIAKMHINRIVIEARMGKFDGDGYRDYTEGGSSEGISDRPVKKSKKGNDDLVVEVKYEPDD